MYQVIECFEPDDDPSKWKTNEPDFVEQLLRNPIQQNVAVLDFCKSKKLFGKN